MFTFSFFFKTQIWPSRFLERCSHFRFWWKSKCEHLSCPNLYRKGVHISIFIKNANVNTFTKIWTARFAFWRKWKCEHVFLYDLFRFAIWNKMKIWTPFRNLNGQKFFGVSTSVVLLLWLFGTATESTKLRGNLSKGRFSLCQIFRICKEISAECGNPPRDEIYINNVTKWW